MMNMNEILEYYFIPFDNELQMVKKIHLQM